LSYRAVACPRGNGAFAASRDIRARGVDAEAAVAGTSLPAQVFGFQDRGELRTGAFADIVIFDPAKVIEKATYQDPHQIAEGIDWVIVNGQIAKKEGEYSGTRAGRVLRR
jgi:N-acyl-D-amino-acid deacylase